MRTRGRPGPPPEKKSTSPYLTITTTELRRHFGFVLEVLEHEPVIAVTNRGRNVALLVSPDFYWLLEFQAGRVSKTEAMRELGITTIHELRVRMADYSLQPTRVSRARAEAMAESALAPFPIRGRKP